MSDEKGLLQEEEEEEEEEEEKEEEEEVKEVEEVEEVEEVGLMKNESSAVEGEEMTEGKPAVEKSDRCELISYNTSLFYQ